MGVKSRAIKNCYSEHMFPIKTCIDRRKSLCKQIGSELLLLQWKVCQWYSLVLSGRRLYICFNNSPAYLIAAHGDNYIGATGSTWNRKITPTRIEAIEAIDFIGIQDTSN